MSVAQRSEVSAAWFTPETAREALDELEARLGLRDLARELFAAHVGDSSTEPRTAAPKDAGA
jgi:hypothetical protein